MHGWQVWIVAGLVLLVAEMFAAGFWLACVAIGSFAAALVALVLPGFLAPVLAFSAATVLSFVALRPFLLRHLHHPPHVRTNVDGLIGKTGIVSQRLDPVTGQGRVVVEGEDWRGAVLDDTPVEAGSRVMVLRVEGTTLFVEKEP